jgi:ATP-dependent Lon protease
MQQTQQKLPLLPLRRGIILPGRATSIPVGRDRSVALARSLSSGSRFVIGIQRDGDLEDPSLDDLYETAVIATLRDKTDRGSRGIFLQVEPLRRVWIRSLDTTGAYLRADVEELEETGNAGPEAEALAESLRGLISDLTGNDGSVRSALEAAGSPGELADIVAGFVDVPPERKVQILGELHVPTRLRFVADLLKEARVRAELRQKVDSEVRSQFSKNQREAVLREQLKAIRRELGEGDEGGDDPLRKKLEEKDLPEEVRKAVDRELRRLESIGGQQAEAHVIRTYLEWIADLPWTERALAKDELDQIRDALEADHYGLDEVKRRVLEHMAVLKLSPSKQATILCLVGPPGVGKTSLAQSVADATGRPLARVSLGGVRDEAEVRGHRRTYVGALPGRIISALRKVSVKNPVIVLDEIDKLGRGWAGDPEAALLEVLDPEQNDKFTDHYMELPFDLSEVLFIATANELSTISPPLRDRLEVIEVNGYTFDEKLHIAKRHLIPRALEKHGLPEGALALEDEVLSSVIKEYTREAGVRQLQRLLAKLCRSIAVEVAAGRKAEGLDAAKVRKILGRPKFLDDVAERFSVPGVAAGLAWTPVGGDILFIETTRMKGTGKVEITGQLGDVMNESARAALAYLRTHADDYGFDSNVLDGHDIHIHVPAGAVPKDGPSAGVTMLTALASLLTGRRVRSDTAMTGEATLRGRVLPVGGIKAKVLAAHRAGFTRVILPHKNEPDLDDVPESVRSTLDVVFVDDMKEVLAAALERDTLADPETNPSKGSSGKSNDTVVAA